ncbi:ABC transporter ATP-binding protein [Actinophytocola sp.]|uniref:ABC transporter ATP-binding protein n=1 Tax=Actinophytocola sp. TaxID=1872138 RepID=UPI002ED40B92
MSTGWSLIRPALASRRRELAALAGWSVLETAPVLLSGQLIARAVDQGFLAGRPATGLLMLGLFAVAMIVGAVGARQAIAPLATIAESVRDHVVRRIVRASLHRAADGDDRTDTAAVTRISRQAEAVRQLVAALLMTMRAVVFSVIAVVLGLLALLPELAWLTVGGLVLSCMLLAVLSPVLRRRYRASLIAEERLADEGGRMLAGLRDIRACGAAAISARRAGQAVADQAAAARATATAGAGRIAVIALGARLPLLVMLLLAPRLVSSGSVTPGQLLGAATYLVTGLEPALRSVVQAVGNAGLQLAVVLKRLAEATVVPATTAPITDRVAARFDLRLRGVTFRYGPYSAPIVEELDLDLHHGAHLAIVGPSGIGKSTLANLITGLTEPEAGQITLGGVPLTELSRPWLRRTIAVVPQESYVFAGTLRENLCYLATSVTDERLDAVVDEFGLRPLVRRTGGYDTDLGNVEALSQGERQLITLARVHLSPAHIVILDEGTCHLDPVTEARVETIFAARGGTLVVIAHRMSSAARAQQVLVLDGQGAQVGAASDLVRRSPLFADMMTT